MRVVHAPIALFLCVVCCSASLPVTHQQQQSTKLTEINFRIKGVGLGSNLSFVRKQLGRPVSSKREKIVDEFEVCGESYTSLLLTYAGLSLEFRGDIRGRNFEVVSFEVTSPHKFSLPAIQFGMSEREVRSKLGKPWQAIADEGFHVLSYVTKGNDGGSDLYFSRGKLVKIVSGYVMC